MASLLLLANQWIAAIRHLVIQRRVTPRPLAQPLLAQHLAARRLAPQDQLAPVLALQGRVVQDHVVPLRVVRSRVALHPVVQCHAFHSHAVHFPAVHYLAVRCRVVHCHADQSIAVRFHVGRVVLAVRVDHVDLAAPVVRADRVVSAVRVDHVAPAAHVVRVDRVDRAVRVVHVVHVVHVVRVVLVLLLLVPPNTDRVEDASPRTKSIAVWPKRSDARHRTAYRPAWVRPRSHRVSSARSNDTKAPSRAVLAVVPKHSSTNSLAVVSCSTRDQDFLFCVRLIDFAHIRCTVIDII